MGQQDEQLCTAFAKMAVRCLVRFNTQDLANTAWALAVADTVASAWCVLPDGAWPRQQHARSGDAIGHSLLCSLVLTTKASCTCQRHGLSRRWARSMGFSDGGCWNTMTSFHAPCNPSLKSGFSSVPRPCNSTGFAFGAKGGVFLSEPWRQGISSWSPRSKPG